jgi:hypothetical protein
MMKNSGILYIMPGLFSVNPDGLGGGLWYSTLGDLRIILLFSHGGGGNGVETVGQLYLVM